MKTEDVSYLLKITKDNLESCNETIGRLSRPNSGDTVSKEILAVALRDRDIFAEIRSKAEKGDCNFTKEELESIRGCIESRMKSLSKSISPFKERAIKRLENLKTDL